MFDDHSVVIDSVSESTADSINYEYNANQEYIMSAKECNCHTHAMELAV